VGKGYGELRILERVDAELRLRRPDVRTTWCGKMPEFFAGAARLAGGRPTMPLPFEALPAVRTWLSRVRPQVLVFVERVWNSTLAVAAARSGVRCLVVNALGWEEPEAGARVGRWETWARRSVGAALARTGFTSERRAAQAAPFLPAQAAVSVTGNVKLELPPAPVTPAVAKELEGWLADRGERPLLAAASTRKGDEAFVLEAFAAVRRVRSCALLLAPREPHRVGGILDLLAHAGLRVSRRRVPGPQADVFLLDTVGELGGVYPHVAAAFIGGTLRHQGQNFVEPLQHAVPVAFGTSEVLLMEEQRHCVASGLGVWVTRPSELAAHWLEVLGRAEAHDLRRQAVDVFLRAHEGALARTVDLVVAELPARVAP
jgi:3-deoxy-D-manno-octulosonic-acid transferase